MYTLWFIQVMDYYSAIKRHELLIHATVCMDHVDGHSKERKKKNKVKGVSIQAKPQMTKILKLEALKTLL